MFNVIFFFLGKLQSEVKKLKTAQKEHSKLLKNQAQYERQVEKLKSEVLDMKRNKVKLVQKMKETDKRHREMETQRNREMSTLKKQTRKNESRIKSLESEKRMKELALKRKSEEVSLLRKAQRRISQIRNPNKKSKLNAKTAKTRWQQVENKITKVRYDSCLIKYHIFQFSSKISKLLILCLDFRLLFRNKQFPKWKMIWIDG